MFLHGYGMRPEDFAPFASAIGVAAQFVFPRGTWRAERDGHAWWPMVDRGKAAREGPRDLVATAPRHRTEARARLGTLVASLRAQDPGRPLILAGFSQGGMLAVDFALRAPQGIDGLVVLSASRLAVEEWHTLGRALTGMPALVAHGQRDDELAFAAGWELRALLAAAGARVEWVPFDGGHEVPLVVWRAVRRFLHRCSG